ncbi:MAG: hypothetical protein ACKVIH_12355 [Burkholderiales bacterium]
MRGRVSVVLGLMVAAVLATALASGMRLAAPSEQPAAAAQQRLALFANFGSHTPPDDVRHVANWVADSRDNGPAPFIVVDKRQARIYVFDAQARLLDSTPVLLGSAPGDDSVPDIGTRALSQVLPHERTTPAGRFVAERGRNLTGEDVVWIDYDAAVSMHRVRTSNPQEKRLERLATPSIQDNRISFGCINVPVAFYETHIRPVFTAQRAIVYVLPEVKSVQEVFGSYDVMTTQQAAMQHQ